MSRALFLLPFILPAVLPLPALYDASGESLFMNRRIMVSLFAGLDSGSVGGKGHRNKACGSCRDRLQWDLSLANLGRKCDRPFRPMTYLSPKRDSRPVQDQLPAARVGRKFSDALSLDGRTETSASGAPSRPGTRSPSGVPCWRKTICFRSWDLGRVSTAGVTAGLTAPGFSRASRLSARV